VLSNFKGELITDVMIICVTVSTVRIEAVLGRTAEMPCNIDPVTRDDRVYMVLWFKEAAGKPLYR